MDVSALKPRPGQPGVLYCCTQTVFSKRLALTDSFGPYVFNYDVSSVSKDFATSQQVDTTAVGQFVALVIQISYVEIRETADQEAYLQVHGLDMERKEVGPLRLWRFGEGDVNKSQIIILRGMKVVVRQSWDNYEHRYMPDCNGTKTVECTFRTAAEDVSHVPEVVQYFES